MRKVKPSERKNIAVAPSFFTRRIYCGRRAPLEHFLSLAIRSRSLREELGYVAVDLAWDACLRSVCLRPVDAVETEPYGAWRELGARLRCAQSAPPASQCDGSPCSLVSRRAGKHLLALKGMLGCAWKALSSRRPLAARFTPLCARQCALFVAHVAEALPQMP